MASFTPLPTEQGIAFNVKNTFVNVDSDDEEDSESELAFVSRSHTEPLSRKGSTETEYCSQDGQDSEDASQPAFSRRRSRSSDGPTASTCSHSSHPSCEDLRSRRPSIWDEYEQGESDEESEDGGLALTVKDTFVDIDDDDDQPARLPGRLSRLPSRGASPLEGFEPEDVEDARDGSGSPWPGAGVASIPIESLMPGTPTPWGTRSQPPGFFFPDEAQPSAAKPAVAFPPGVFVQPPRALVAPPMQVAAPAHGMRPQNQHQQQKQKQQQQQKQQHQHHQQQVNQGGYPAPIMALATDKSLTVTQNRVACRVEWTVDVKKIRGSEKNIVSMPFDVVMWPGTEPVVFKLMLYPKVAAGSSGSSFRRAHGIGCVQLKCCSDIPEKAKRATAVSVSVGSTGVQGGVQGARGPFEHRFHSSSIFKLPRDQADWNFSAAVEKSKAVFTVTVEMAHFE